MTKQEQEQVMEIARIVLREYDEVRKETAKKIFRDIFKIIFTQYVDEIGRTEKYIDSDLFVDVLRKLAKKYNVEVEE